MSAHGVHDLIDDLEKALGAEQVKFDQMTRLLYSTDASNYQIMPIGVTFPRNGDDVVAIHEIAAKHKTPLLPRGGGSSLAGQAVGQAVVMDFSRHMRRVRSINADEQTVVVEPGLILGQLNAQLQSMGLMFGPDPASAERAAIGGCLGNNATGSHSILYGMSSDNVKRLEIVFASGERCWLDENSAKLTQLRQKIGALVTANQAEIEAHYPKTFRTVAGYALNKIDPRDVDLNWLMVGSEGTLGTIAGAELNLVRYRPPTERRLAIVHFDTLRESLEATPRILEIEPSAVELIDRFMLNKTRQKADFAPRMTFIDGDPAVVLVVEFYGESDAELTSKINGLKQLLQRIGHAGAVTIAATPGEQGNVWFIRKSGLGLIMSERGDQKPITFVEDAAVPVEHLADYIDTVADVVEREGTTFAIYAHASAGCLHVRPLVNLKSIKGREQYRNIADALTTAAISYSGTITGEHGQGLVRGEFTERMFGAQLTQAFRDVKTLFDPDKRMNPGKIVDTLKMDDPNILRYNTDYKVIPLQTRYDWSVDGGLSGAAEMCNGAGVCRKEGNGTMCPSYMATLDETHATRGRANALRLAMSGKLPHGLGSPELKGVFDLCLSCKACKAECPSSVDVARMKAEYLAASYDGGGVPIATRIFANIHRLNALASRLPGLANMMLRNPLGLFGARLVGLPTERPLPAFAKERFSRTAATHPASAEADATLIIDTFTEFNHPEIGAAVLKIADALDLKLNIMRLPGQGCCGRPAISKGVLDLAKDLANTNIRHFSRHVQSGVLIFLEPSCQSAFTDDYPGLVAADLREAAESIASRCVSAETWLHSEMVDQTITWDETPREILLHGHCHQKALWGTTDTLRLLRLIPNADVKEIDSGCCGVAGSFGYEHYDLSMKIANQRLLPTIANNPDALVAAPGTSCRTQIHDAGHQAAHPVQLMADALQ
jgi:FAD/FMN-containing dehydrogenase/Fe-S oxidoreductase